MRVLWYWPHPQRQLSPAATPLLAAGDSLVVQCLDTHRGEPGDDPRVDFRRELPEPRELARLPPMVRRFVRIETYIRRTLLRARLVRTGAFDVCHVQTLNYLTDAFSLGRVRRRVPVVAVVHDVVPHEERMPAWLEAHLLRRVYGSADVYVVFHDVLAERLRHDFAVPGDRIFVTPIPIAPVAAATPTGDSLGEVPTGPVRFLFFGSFRTDKGLPVLIDAARDLTGDRRVEVHVVGAGDANLERLVGEATAEGAVTSEIGRASPERKDANFRRADVVVLPYDDPERFQSQSAVLADAYGYRRPLLVTDVGAIGPTIRRDATGWVVPPGDCVALAAKMLQVADDGAGREQVSAAIEPALARHSYDAYGRRLRAAYDEARRLRGFSIS